MKHIYFKIYFLIAAISMGCCLKTNAQFISSSDSTALAAFYNSTGGSSWTSTTSSATSAWIAANPVSQWYGVTVTGTKVTALNLSNNNLSGSITALNTLSSASSGSALGNLVTLDLSKNLLTSTMSFNGSSFSTQTYSSATTNGSNIINLTSYTTGVSVGWYVSGTGIPNATYITAIAGSSFTLSNNATVTGTATLSFFLPRFGQLQLLNLSNNQLSGAVPSCGIGFLTGGSVQCNPLLTYINLSYNLFTSGVNNGIGNPPSQLQTYIISHNLIAGALQGYITGTLWYIDLSYNSISGSILFSSSMRTMNFSHNLFTGSVPYLSSTNLTSIDLSYNQLSGTLNYYPAPNITYCNLASNVLSGNLPTVAGSSGTPTAQIGKPNLTYFNIDSNRFVSANLGAVYNNFINSAVGTGLYTGQDTILPVAYSASTLTVGITADANNTFKWYKNGSLASTTTGTSGNTFATTGDGIYTAVVTNSGFPLLSLNSATYTLSSTVTNYYSKATGNLELLTNWGLNTDGSGTNPADFTSANQVFNIVNQPAATIGAAWTVSGANSKIVVGNGSSNVNFTIPAAFAVTGTIDALYRDTLTIINTTVPTIGTMATGSIVLFNGTASQTIPTATYDVITINNAAGCTLGGNISVATNLNLTAGLLALGNNNITLLSTASSTASVPTIGSGTLSYGTGGFVVQRYIPSNGRKAYVMVSSPVSSPSIYNAWQEAGATVSSFGTQITGATSGSGFDAASASGAASIYTYNDANTSGTKWVGLTNTNATTLAAGKGYLLYVRGDRSEARNITLNSSNTILRATGTISTGNVTVSGLTSGASKFSLIANPYPSAIDWNSASITKTNITSSFYVYDPVLAVFVTSNGTTVSPSNSKQYASFIQSGEAFFIQNSSSGLTPSITFKEAAKTKYASSAVTNTVFGNEVAPSQLNINVYRQGNVFADGVVALFNKNYKAFVSDEDAEKLKNFNETFSLKRNNTNLSIEGRPSLQGNDTLFFGLENFGKREYVLNIDALNFKNTTATLEDRYTNTKQAIDMLGSTAYNFTVTDEDVSKSNDRFIITLGSTATIVAATDVADNNNFFVKLSPNPVSNQLQVNFKTAATETTIINLINSLGQVVKTVTVGKVNVGNVQIAVNGLSAGLYTVQLLSGDKQIASQKIIKQ